MFEVLATVEDRAAELALGPVVAVDFAAGEIELAFSVLAANVQGAHDAVGRVLHLIDSDTDVKLTPEPQQRARRKRTRSAAPSASPRALSISCAVWRSVQR